MRFKTFLNQPASAITEEHKIQLADGGYIGLLNCGSTCSNNRFGCVQIAGIGNEGGREAVSLSPGDDTRAQVQIGNEHFVW